MQKVKHYCFLGLILLFAACASTQYPVGKRKAKRKKKCDCPDFGSLENGIKREMNLQIFPSTKYLSNLNEVA